MCIFKSFVFFNCIFAFKIYFLKFFYGFDVFILKSKNKNKKNIILIYFQLEK